MIEKNTLESAKRLKKERNFRPLMAFFSVFAALAAILLLTGVAPFGPRSVMVSDLSAQYAPYLITMRNKILHGGSPYYSFEIGMGKSLPGIIAYYCSSPLNLISLLFPVSHISDAIVLIIMLKLSFAGAFMTALIDYKFSSKTKMSILFGMIYALSSYSMSFIFNFIWLDGFALLPLLILVIEKFRKDIRQAYKVLLVLIVLFASNYYIAYMVGIFSFFYLIGVLEYDRKNDRTAGSPSSAKALGVFILTAVFAAMVCAALLLPAGIDTIVNGDRSASASISMDPPFSLIQFLPYVFLAKLSDISTNMPFIFSSLAVLELVVLFFMNPDIPKRLRIRVGIAFTLGIISFLMPVLNMAWHLFDNPNWFLYRYSFLFIFGMILVAFYSFLHIRFLQNKHFIAMFGLLFALLLIAERFSGLKEGESMYFQNLILLLLIALCLFGLSKEKWSDQLANLKKLGSGILVPIVLVEIVFLAPRVTVGAIWNDTEEASDFQTEVEELQELTSSLDSSEGYRVERAWFLSDNIDSLNLSSYTETNGIGAFCSMSNKKQHRFLKQLGYCTNFNYFSSEHRAMNLPADSFLGVKYIVSSVEEISGIDPVGTYGRYTLFENPYATDIVFLADAEASGFDGYSLETMGEGKDYFKFQEDWMSSLSGIPADKVYDTKALSWEVMNAQEVSGDMADITLEYDKEKNALDLEDVEKYSSELTFYLRNNSKSPILLRAKTKVEKDGPVYLSIPFLMHSAPVSIYCNDIPVYVEESSSYFSVIVDTGVHSAGEEITIEVRCDDDIFASFTPSIAVCDTEELGKQTEAVKTGISDLSVSDGKVTFTATADEQKTLIATIPYENGWTATVDGEKVEISSYQDAFILLPMAPGTHTVELTFVPNGMGIGVIISALGVLFSVALIVVTRKKHQERKAEEEIKLDREEDS